VKESRRGSRPAGCLSWDRLSVSGRQARSGARPHRQSGDGRCHRKSSTSAETGPDASPAVGAPQACSLHGLPPGRTLRASSPFSRRATSSCQACDVVGSHARRQRRAANRRRAGGRIRGLAYVPVLRGKRAEWDALTALPAAMSAAQRSSTTAVLPLVDVISPPGAGSGWRPAGRLQVNVRRRGRSGSRRPLCRGARCANITDAPTVNRRPFAVAPRRLRVRCSA
jgi:hypothetical protein